MKYYLDTEFNGFGGALMSLALVPDDVRLPAFYRVVDWGGGEIDPWVKEHVVPFLGGPPQPRAAVSAELADFLARAESPTVVADWPTDFEHLLSLLIVGPGQMASAPDFGMEFRRLPGFNTADHSRIPHNALSDAWALRHHCVATTVRIG